VVGYGKKYWQDYQELFPSSIFLKNGQFLVARDEKLVVVLTDHFTARTMNGKFDEVVSIINEAQNKRKAG
jgi:hypothetical protein